MAGWHHRHNRHKFEQTSGDGEGQGKPGVLQTMGLQRVRRDLATEQQQKRQRCPCPNSRICEYVKLNGKRLLRLQILNSS